MVLGGAVTGYLRGQRGIKQSMAGSKGACSTYEALGSFDRSLVIKEDPIVGKSVVVFDPFFARRYFLRVARVS